MDNSQISKAYANAISDISESSGVKISEELTNFSELISKSNDLENLLFLDVFTAEERLEVLDKIFIKEKFNTLTINFIKFLIVEKRFNLFNLIYKDIIVKEDLKLGFISGVVEGGDTEPDEKLLQQIKKYIEEKIGLKTRVKYKQNGGITAGYKATVGDLQIDATLESQLNNFKQEIINN